LTRTAHADCSSSSGAVPRQGTRKRRDHDNVESANYETLCTRAVGLSRVLRAVMKPAYALAFDHMQDLSGREKRAVRLGLSDVLFIPSHEHIQAPRFFSSIVASSCVTNAHNCLRAPPSVYLPCTGRSFLARRIEKDRYAVVGRICKELIKRKFSRADKRHVRAPTRASFTNSTLRV
jgi:hypothetical protein